MGDNTRAPTAAIIVIGDEVLSGKVEEQNARFLVRELRKLGVAVRRIEVIPDVPEEIAATVRSASARFDIVFTAGGIGPTHDDVTIAAIAMAFSVPVVRNADLATTIRTLSGDRFYERDLRMADLPAGADLLYGAGICYSRWPVIAFRNIYVLPGVPSILHLLVRGRRRHRPCPRQGRCRFPRRGHRLLPPRRRHRPQGAHHPRRPRRSDGGAGLGASCRRPRRRRRPRRVTGFTTEALRAQRVRREIGFGSGIRNLFILASVPSVSSAASASAR